MSLKNSLDTNGLNHLLIQPPIMGSEKLQILQNTDRIVREAECKLISGLCRTSRFEKEKKGLFPKRIQISERAIGWRLSDLMAWVEERANAK